MLDDVDLLRTYVVDDLNVKGRTALIRVVPYGVPTMVRDSSEQASKGRSRRPYREAWKLGAFRHAVKASHRVPFVVGVVGGHNARRENPYADVGRAINLVERDDALYGDFAIDASPFGEHALAKIESGQWRGVSVGAKALKFADEGDPFHGGTRWRTLAALDHVLLTEHPAYADAQVLTLREAEDELPRVAHWLSKYPRPA